MLDDIFSSMDVHASEKIFASLLGPEGLLRLQKASVILVTHSRKPPDHVKLTLR